MIAASKKYFSSFRLRGFSIPLCITNSLNLKTITDLQLMSWSVIVVSLLVSSCREQSTEINHILEKLGTNRNKIESVVSHYKNNMSDSIKLKSAYYLIQDLVTQKSYEVDSTFNQGFDLISRIPFGMYRRDIFEKLLDSITQRIEESQETNLVRDIDSIDEKFLIENIELAYTEWRRIPAQNRATFNDFCRYILPYKSKNEPLEKGSRLFLLKKYSWAKKMILNGSPIKEVVDSVLRSAAYVNMVNIGRYYKPALSISQIEKSKLGRCDDGVNYFVNVFRAIGIPCAGDYIPQWGNHNFSGHSWLYIKFGNQEYATNIGGEGKDVRCIYIGESIPKVYRLTFDKNTEDVTSFYTPVVDLENKIDISNSDTAGSNLTLNVFNSYYDWFTVQKISKISKRSYFRNVGVNVIYQLGLSAENGHFKPLNYPFLIDSNKTIHYFKPQSQKLTSARILRKTGLVTARNKIKLNWLKCLNESIIEVSNDSNFSSSKRLYSIKNLGSFQNQIVFPKELAYYRYLKFNSHGKEAYLAAFSIKNRLGKTIALKYLPGKRTMYLGKIENLYDNDPISFFGGKNFSLKFRLPDKTKIESLEFQARNDGNQIIPGCRYELFVFDKNWHSLGETLAKDTSIIFTKLPGNALFRIRNLDMGTEEHIFSIDHTGNQKWHGFVR
jgi:hypothetical protein